MVNDVAQTLVCDYFFYSKDHRLKSVPPFVRASDYKYAGT